MSITLTATLGPKCFLVKITREGQMIFLDHDIAYDLSMAEFGEHKTPGVFLLNLWEEAPYKVIFKHLELSKHDNVLLLADYAEHVLPIYEKWSRNDSRPRNAIQTTREYLNAYVGSDRLDNEISSAEQSAAEALETARMASEEAAFEDVALAIAAAAAAEAAWTTVKMASWASGVLRWMAAATSESAIVAAMWAAKAGIWPEDSRAREISWQICRLVDVMEAVQAGKPWPSIKGTP